MGSRASLLRLCSVLLLWSAYEEINSIPFDPPRIIPEIEEMVVSSGESLHLKCESKKPIKWTTPKHKIVEEGLPDIRVNVTTNINSDYPYISHLEVFNLSVTYTGYYYCRFEENHNLNAVEEVANVYVYVNDSISLLVANDYFIHLTSIQHEEVTIPCKPSSPDVNVTLSKDEEIVFPSADNFVTYNPKLGYKISGVNFHVGGLYICEGRRGNVMADMSIDLRVLPHTNDVPKPQIEDKKARHVVVGSAFRLDCIVKMELSVIFNLEWSTPNQFANESGRLEIGDPISSKIKQNTYEYTLGSRYLMVHNVTSADQGYYNCTVMDHTHKEKSDEKFVRVFEANITYINFTVQGNVAEIRERAGKNSVQWVVHVAAHPYPRLIWYDPNGEEIKNISAKYEVYSDSTQTKLKINNIDISDAGLYQLKGISREVEKTLNLTLIVYDAPTVELSGQMYYMYGQSHTVNCSVIGYPVPDVTWHFKSCERSFQNCDEKDAKIDESQYKEIYLNGKRGKTSILEIIAIKSGQLTCLACNSVRCEPETIPFFVTDILNGFDARVLPADPVVGDNVTLSCGASVYNYTDSISWYKHNPANSKSELITNTLGYKVISTTSQFSRKVDIKIDNINMTHAGRYICRVEKISDDPDEEDVEVTVQKIQKPIFVNSSMNDSYYYVDPGAKVEWRCIAKGVPKPSVIWYKDGILLKVKKQVMELSNDNQTLKITYANFEDKGRYTCKVTNKGGTIKGSVTLAINDNRSNGILIGMTILGVFLLIVVIFLIVKNQKEKKLRKELMFAGLANFEDGALENINPELGVDDQAELLPYDKKWEFPREKLKLGKQLGSGAFGVVMKADAYGIVEGEALTTVAVKMVKRNAEYTHIKALASELKIMVHLGKHLNVVNLLGACTKNLTKRELLVIVEYCRFGNLQNYLLRHREDFIDQIDPLTGKVVPERGMEHDIHSDASTSKAREADPRASSIASQGSVQDYRAAPMVKEDSALCNGITGQTVNTDMSLVSMSPSGEECGATGGSGFGGSEPDWRTNYRGDYGRRDVRPICTSDLICWAFQVARGIDYLASRRVLHGDLAARNILLAEDNVVKICDFGLAKSMYKSDNYKKKGDGPLPVKWMAIESIRDRVFSTQSDVWSFGIVLWEFFSLARTPYPGMEADEKLYNKLIAGYRMEKPQYATDEIYSVMLDCWKGKPSERPTFTDLTEKLGGMLEETVKRHYIDLNSPYMTMNDKQQESTDYLGMMSEPSYANAMREMTPQREYVNMPSQPENPALDYMTMSSPVPPVGDDGTESESGYLCMRSGSMGNEGNPAVIFSPRPNPTQTFDFEMLTPQNAAKFSPKLRAVETKGAEGPELSPMLPVSTLAKDAYLQKEDSLDSGMGSPNSYFNPTYRSLPNTNGHILPNNEIAETNYINIPQSKERQSHRSSGFQSDGGEVSPLPEKNLSSFEIPLKMST